MIIKIRFGKEDELEIDSDGFYPTWAYATADENKSYWEFDICHKKTGLDNHLQIGFSRSIDVLETELRRAIEPIAGQLEVLAA